MSKEQYTSVSEMISGISDDAQFNKEMDDRLCSRQIIKSLVAMRAARGVSQSDIARELGCTQSRVSKIENGFDGDLQLSDLSAYAKVLGLEFQLLTAKRGMLLADRVKYHACGVRDALLKLVGLAHKDDKIVQGVAKLHVELFMNIMKILQETSSQLPPCPDNGRPYIRIASCDDPDEDGRAPMRTLLSCEAEPSLP